ncbi:unnamed protein product [Victoria cruziana]
MTRPSSSRGRRKNREELAILARSCPSHLFSLFTFFLLSLISSLFMFLLVACPSSSSLTVENIRRRHGLQGKRETGITEPISRIHVFSGSMSRFSC